MTRSVRPSVCLSRSMICPVCQTVRYARVAASNAFDRGQHGMVCPRPNAISGGILLCCAIPYYVGVGSGTKYCNQRVAACLSVRVRISKTARPNFVKFALHVSCGHDSVLPRQCKMLCISGFVNDAMFHTMATHNAKSRIERNMVSDSTKGSNETKFDF